MRIISGDRERWEGPVFRCLAVISACLAVLVASGLAVAAETITLWTKEAEPILPEIERLAQEFTKQTGSR